MNSIRGYQSYRQVSTQTASPGQLVVMMYDGAIRFLERALAGFAQEDPLEFNQTINNNVIRAQTILSELDGCLNLAAGGELAQTLRRLYHYMDDQLTRSNVEKRPEGIRDVVRRLTVLRDAWREMLARGASTEGAPETEFAGLCACG